VGGEGEVEGVGWCKGGEEEEEDSLGEGTSEESEEGGEGSLEEGFLRDGSLGEEERIEDEGCNEILVGGVRVVVVEGLEEGCVDVDFLSLNGYE
jgi:hypothetical protein